MYTRKLDTAQIDRYANNLGVTIKYSAEIQKLVKLRDAANTYMPPEAEPLGELLFRIPSEKWDDSLRDWAATKTLPDSRQISSALDDQIAPALNAAIRADRDSILAQAYAPAKKAADTLAVAVKNGIHSLTDYAAPAHAGTTAHLIDAQKAVDVLHVYTQLAKHLADTRPGGNATIGLGAIVEPPASLSPLAVKVKYATGADPRWTQPGHVTVATADAEKTWRANHELQKANEHDRILTVALGAYPGGYRIAPAKTMAAIVERADHFTDALGSDVVNKPEVSRNFAV